MVSKLVFYSKSADKTPEKGAHEELNSNADFAELSRIKDWRKKLSNMYVSPFIVGNYTYNSVEHFFHAMKFHSNYPDFARTFTVSSNSKWSKDPFLAKIAGKSGRLSKAGKVFKTAKFTLPTNVKIRDDFYNGFDRKVLTLGLYSKFSQNEDLKKLLLSTKNAKLYHLVTRRGQKSLLEHWSELEIVRKCITKFPTVILSFDFL